jgi:hypothetical protein
MNFVLIKSSRIKKAAYIKEESTLVLVFNDGKEYEYNNVPHSVYAALIASKSPGKYFETEIKNNYTYERTK